MMNKGTAILGFVLSFLTGMALMYGLDKSKGKGTSMSAEGATAAARTGSAKAGAVSLDLHVMSQCPYGVQAENALKEVVEKFGPDLDLNIEFIGSGSAENLSSMHGANEVKGNLVQVCAQKHAPDKAFDFILCQNENYKEVATNGAACAAKLGISYDTISACAEGAEGKKLLADSFERSQKKGARGSPTIFIAGNQYQGGRKPKDFMKGICNAASGKKPKACSDIPESPKVNVTLLSDTRCGADCNTRRTESQIRSRIDNPVLTMLDYASAEGKKLYEAIKPANLPAIVFDRSLDADKDAVAAFSRGVREVGGYKVLGSGGWNPACADDGGCALAECKETMQCRQEEAKQLDVFVMSECPYGVKALNAMRDVIDNFKKAGESFDFSVHFIGDGDENSLKSMHGQSEVDEDLREICAIEHYGKNLKYMDYIWCRNKSIRDKNWQACTGGTTGIATDVIKRCSEGAEGKKLLAASFAKTRALGIGASPTWLANNKFKFSGIDPERIKSSFCEHNKIKGCENTLAGKPAPPAGAAAAAAAEPGCG